MTLSETVRKKQSACSARDDADGPRMLSKPSPGGASSYSFFPCRFCHSPLQRTFVDLGMSPLSNAYLDEDRLNKMEAFYPLHVHICERCLLVQLQEFESPAHLFKNYLYFSSYSQSAVKHAKTYSSMIIDRFGITTQNRVVEIASNDGYLLQHFGAKGIPVLGIEPASNIAEVAIRKGIPTIIKFFNRETAHQLRSEGFEADVLVGNNVLAHVPDLNDFLKALKILLGPHGVITMEFPHLMRLMEEKQFDTIYHEHLSYFSFSVVNNVFLTHGLRIFDVEEIPTHGGSLRIYASHAEDSSKPIFQRVPDLLEKEKTAGLFQLSHYLTFADRVKETKRKLLDFLIGLKRDGKVIVGYGAPAKGNTLLNYCGIGSDFLDYTVDQNPHKQGRFLPGSHIPILAPDKIQETKPDYLLILPWNLKEEIMDQMAHVRKWGCQFLVPIPEVKVIP